MAITRDIKDAMIQRLRDLCDDESSLLNGVIESANVRDYANTDKDQTIDNSILVRVTNSTDVVTEDILDIYTILDVLITVRADRGTDYCDIADFISGSLYNDDTTLYQAESTTPNQFTWTCYDRRGDDRMNDFDFKLRVRSYPINAQTRELLE